MRERDWRPAFPSPSGRRWRKAPDEGFVKVGSVYITLTPNPSPEGRGETAHA
jgi:hypothetical protein